MCILSLQSRLKQIKSVSFVFPDLLSDRLDIFVSWLKIPAINALLTNVRMQGQGNVTKSHSFTVLLDLLIFCEGCSKCRCSWTCSLVCNAGSCQETTPKKNFGHCTRIARQKYNWYRPESQLAGIKIGSFFPHPVVKVIESVSCFCVSACHLVCGLTAKVLLFWECRYALQKT